MVIILHDCKSQKTFSRRQRQIPFRAHASLIDTVKMRDRDWCWRAFNSASLIIYRISRSYAETSLQIVRGIIKSPGVIKHAARSAIFFSVWLSPSSRFSQGSKNTGHLSSKVKMSAFFSVNYSFW